MASLRDVFTYSVPEGESNKYPKDKRYHDPKDSQLRYAGASVVPLADRELK